MTNKVKFSSDINPGFISELREKVKIYFRDKRTSKYGNMNILLKSVFMLSIYLMPYFLMLTGVISSIPLVFLCWIIMGIGMAGVGMGVMHDANHGTYSKSKTVNNLLGKSLYILGGYPPNWKFQHNTLHHAYTNIDGHDDDISTISILRFSPHKPLLKVHQFQHWYAWFFYGLMTISWAINKDFSQLSRYKQYGSAYMGKKSYWQMLIEILLGKVIYYTVFLILPLLIMPVSWYWTLIFFLAMHFICGVILGIVFQTAHVVTDMQFPKPDGNGNIENNWAIHQLSTTSDYSPGSRFFSWLIGGLNYQVEHHLFPNVSHVHYRSISTIVQETAQKYGLQYHVKPTFFSALINHIRMLKILGQKPAGISL